MREEIINLLVSDFRQFVQKTLPKIHIKFSENTKGYVEYNSSTTFPARIVLPSSYDEYTQKFILLHELGHLYANQLGLRQNEFLPDLLATAYLYYEGYDPVEILSILDVLYSKYENHIRAILAFLLLYFLEKQKNGNGCPNN